ncbi:unnamed protein product [Peniophora sp. CBMAI 1063]|nr:unnamed protein product [Peniophora sp. CBMAI 1063]
MAYNLLSLPPELILRILEWSDYRSIVHSAKSCRLLRGLITNSRRLEYVLALARTGMQDLPRATYTAKQRLDLIVEHETAWSNLRWRRRIALPPQAVHIWELYGGIWAQSGDHCSISFVRLPSIFRNISMKKWSYISEFTILDFTLDSSSDLLVLLQHAGKDSIKIHLQSLTSGDTHPEVTAPIPLYTISPDRGNYAWITMREWCYNIRVHGRYLGIFFENVYGGDLGTRELCVWDWRTGEMRLRLTSQELRSFVFLADNLVMVSSAESPLVPPHHPDLWFSSLDIYEIPSSKLPMLDLNIDEAQSQNQPVTVAWCLALPVLGKNPAHEILLHSDPSPSWRHTGPAPFCTAPDNRLIVVDYTFERRSTVSFFVKAETVLEHVRRKGTRGTYVPWLQWGPGQVYAVGDFGHEEAWAGGGFVHGMRYIHPHPARSRNPSNPLSIVVWDFHPRRVAAARSKDGAQTEVDVVPRPRLPEELSEAWFPNGVGEPPFVIRQMSVPEDLRMSADIRFMIEEDTIIVHQTTDNGQLKTHFLTF